MRDRAIRGVTYLELLATAAILMILASAILPLGRVAQKRHDEIELRRALRTMRRAIDQYKAAVDQNEEAGNRDPDPATEENEFRDEFLRQLLRHRLSRAIAPGMDSLDALFAPGRVHVALVPFRRFHRDLDLSELHVEDVDHGSCLKLIRFKRARPFSSCPCPLLSVEQAGAWLAVCAPCGILILRRM